MTRIWIIGGGVLQLPIITEAKDRGYETIVSDGNPQCAAVEARLVDKFLEKDTYDIEGHLRAAKKIARPSAVLTDAADVGPTVSALAEFYTLPACSYDAAVRTRDKAAMRKATKLPHPAYTVIGRDMYPVEAWVAWEKLAVKQDIKKYSCVVKAADNCASRGLSMVRSEADWRSALERAGAANKQSTELVIEEQLSGPECATDWFVQDGKVIYVNGAKRIFSQTHFGLEVGHTNPWHAPQEVLDLAQTCVERLGVTQGPFKMDLLEDALRLVSTGMRDTLVGGFDHTHTAVMATGRNLIGQLLNYALGKPVDLDLLRMPIVHRYAACYTPIYAPGNIAGWKGIDDVRAVGGQVIVRGDQNSIVPMDSCASRPVFVLVDGETEEEAWTRRELGDWIKPIYT